MASSGQAHPLVFGSGTDVGEASLVNNYDSADAYWYAPWEAVDEYGDIYVAFSVDETSADVCLSTSAAGWSVGLAVSINGGSSFATQCIIAPASGYTFSDPVVSVSPTASTVCLVASYFKATSNTYLQGDYYYVCTGSGASALHGGTETWGTLTDGGEYDKLCSLYGGKAATDDAYSTVQAAVDDHGYLIVAAWGYETSACSTFGIELDTWTSPVSSTSSIDATFVTSTTLGGNVASGIGYFAFILDLACSTGVVGCAVFYEISNYPSDTPTVWYLESLTTSGADEFYTSYTGPTIMARHAWTDTDANAIILDPGGASFAPSGDDAAMVFQYDAVTGSGAIGSTGYDMNYTYSTNLFASGNSAGNDPISGATFDTDAAIALEGASAEPFVSYNDTSQREWVTAATSQTGSFSTVRQIMGSLGSWGAQIQVCNYGGSGCTASWEVDVTYSTDQTTSQTYFDSSFGPNFVSSSGSTSPATVNAGSSTTLSATAQNGVGWLSYNYSGLPTGCTSSNTSSLTCSPTAVGTYSSMVMCATDAWGFLTCYKYLPTLTVNTAVTISVSPASASVDAGQTYTMTATPSPSGSYTYQWLSGSLTCSSGSDVTGGSGSTTATYTTGSLTAGTGYYCASIPADVAYSNVVTLTTNAALSVTNSPASESIDSGQTIAFQGSWTGGTSSFTAKLYSSTTTSTCSSMATLVQTVSSATTPTSFTAVTPAAGTDYYCVWITDSSASGAETGYSSTSTITVNSDLSTPTISPSSESIDSGQTIAFSTTWSGGTANYVAYLYDSASATCASPTQVGASASQATTSYTFSAVSPSSADPYYCINIVDSSAAGAETSAYSTVVDITVNADLSVTNSPSSESIDSGQTIAFHGSWTGGTSSFTAKLYSSTTTSTCSSMATLVQTVSSATTPTSFTAVTPAAGTDYYCVWITDSSAAGAETGYSSTSTITVNADLSVTNSPSSESIDSGQTIAFQGSWTGGTSSFTAKLYSSTTTSTCSSMATLVQTVSSATTPTSFTAVTPAAGTDYYCVWITDSSAAGAETGYSSTSTITVNSDLSTPTISPSSESIDSGQTIAFSTTWSGGTANYVAYLYDSASATCASPTQVGASASQATTSYTFSAVTPSSADPYYCINVKDSSAAGAETSAYSTVVDITVNSALSSGTVGFSSASIDNGQAIGLTVAAATTGTSPYTYQWYTSTTTATCSSMTAVSGGSGATTTSYTTATLSTGTNYFCAWTTDSSAAGHETAYSSTITITVNADPTLSPAGDMTLSGAIEAGQTARFHVWGASGTGANGSWTWNWQSLPTGCTASGTNLVTCSPSPGGAYTLTLVITDLSQSSTGGFQQTLTESFIVAPAGSDLPTVTMGEVPALPADVGSPITFNLTASGGTGNYTTYTWTESSPDLGCILSNTPTIYCYPTVQGDYTVSASVTDTDGATSRVRTSGDYQIDAALDPGTVSANTLTLEPGQYAYFESTSPSGGTPSYSYQWFAGSSPDCSSDTMSLGGTGSSEWIAPASSEYICVEYEDSSGGAPPAATFSNTLLVTLVAPLGAGYLLPSPAAIDLGQSLELDTSAPYDGIPAYSYQWLSGPSADCASDTPIGGATTTTLMVAPTSSTYFCVQYSDASEGSPAALVYSAPLQVGVYAALAAGAISPGSAVLDAGQSVDLTAGATGGVPGLTYAWEESATGLGACDAGTPVGGSLSAQSVSPTVSTYYCYQVSDSSTAGIAISPSPWMLVTVDPALLPGSISPGSASLDLGQSLTLVAGLPSGGTSPFTLQWVSGSSSVCSSDTVLVGQTSYSLVLTPSSSAYYCAAYYDASQGAPQAIAYSAAVFLTVNPPLLAGAVSPSSPAIDAGESILLTSAAPSGGTSGFTYQWLAGPSATCSSDGPVVGQTTLSSAFAPSQSTYYCLEVTDASAGSPAAVAFSNVVRVVVALPLVAGSIASPGGALDQGQSAMLLASAPSGGTPTYSYQWVSGSTADCADDSPVAGATSLTLGVAPDQSTYYCVAYMDASVGSPAAVVFSASLQLLVDPALLAGTIAPASASIDQGQTLTLTGTSPSGGSPGFTFQWLAGSSATCASDSAIPGQTRATLVEAPTASSFFCLAYGDASVGAPSAVVYSNTAWVAVNGALSAGQPATSAATVDASQTAVLSSVASLGTSPYSFQWFTAAIPGACSSADSPITGATSGTYTTPSSLPPGLYLYCYQVADSSSAGVQTAFSSTVAITVAPDPTLSTLTEVAPTPCSASCEVDALQTLSIAASASGGSGTYVFSWSVVSGSSACIGTASGTTTSVYTCRVAALATAQLWTIQLALADSSGCCAGGAPESFSVELLPEPSVSLSAAASMISLGSSLEVSANVEGGASPFVYTWFLDGSAVAGASGSTYAFDPNVAGTYTISVALVDADGTHAVSANLTVHVNPTTPSQPTGSAQGWSGELDALVLADLAVAAGIVVLLVLPRKKGSPPRGNAREAQGPGSEGAKASSEESAPVEASSQVAPVTSTE